MLGALFPEQRPSLSVGQVEQTPSVFQLWDAEERTRQLFHVQNVR